MLDISTLLVSWYIYDSPNQLRLAQYSQAGRATGKLVKGKGRPARVRPAPRAEWFPASISIFRKIAPNKDPSCPSSTW